MGQPLVIMGASTRAAAQSAIRAGFEPWCVDLFADRDLTHIAPVKRCRYSFYPEGMIEKMRAAPPSKVLITGAIEHYPDALRALALKRPLFRWNLKQIFSLRDPRVWREAPQIEGVKYPAVLTDGQAPDEADKSIWLVKPLDTTHPRPAIKRWRNDEKPPVGCYLQQWIQGTPVGAVYACRAGRCLLLGVTRQLVGDAHFHASPMVYCGSVGPIALTPGLHRAFQSLGDHLAERFELEGVFNIDAILDDDGAAWPVEINPRYSASVEIFERAYDIAALSDELPRLPQQGSDVRVWGKAYVFNGWPRTLYGADVLPHLPASFDEAADIPQPWRRIPPGGPICTLFAQAESVDACVAALHDRAARLYTALSK